MISFYGDANPELQRAIIDFCFCQKKDGVPIIDQAIINDSLSGEQLRMLPLIYTKSSILEFSTFSQSRIKGMYKYTLFRNHSLLVSALKIHGQLKKSGYETIIFLKGVASILTNEKHLGQRPMADIDLLVPEFSENIEKSLEFIKENGYLTTSYGSKEVTLRDKESNEYDVHWYLNNGALKKITVEKILRHATIVTYRNVNLMVPCAEHQLAHTILHGLFSSTLTFDGRWVIDVLEQLHNIKKIDHELFLDFISDFTLPSKIKFGLRLILAKCPDDALNHKEALVLISNRIDHKNKILQYFYNQKPRPNVIFQQDKKINCWIKSGICTHIIEPLMISKYNQVSFFKALGLTFKFPPPNFKSSILLLLNKIYQRLKHRMEVLIEVK